MKSKPTITKKPAAKRMAAKKSTAPATSAAPLSFKETLAAGVKKFREEEAKAAAAKPKAEAKPAKAIVVVEPPVKAVVVAKGDINDILERHVKMTDGNSAVHIDKDTPAGEYVRIFDYFNSFSEKVQFLLGDVINAGENILGEKYEAVMAATQRPIGQLKQYAYVARNVPPSLRNLHPKLLYTHVAEVAKVPQLEDKKAILDAAAKAANDGHPMTVKEVRLKADKLVPRKTGTKGKKPGSTRKGGSKGGSKGAPPPLEMNAEQQAMYDDILERAQALEEAIGGKNAEVFRGFIFKTSYKVKKALLDAVKPVMHLANNLEKYIGYPS